MRSGYIATWIAIVMLSPLAAAGDINGTLVRAQQALDDQRPSAAIQLLESALPVAKGDERVLSLLRRAYRVEIPRLLKVDRRADAQRLLDRLRLIEGEAAGNDLATGESSGSESLADNVKVVLPDRTNLPTVASQQSAWRSAKQPIGRPTENIQPTAIDLSTRPAVVPPARILAAQPEAARHESESAGTDSSARSGVTARERARRLVIQADALFVARYFSEASDLYTEASQASPETVETARERWAYCRLFRAVNEMNAAPKNASSWSAIKAELQSILEAVPGNSFTQSLLSIAERHGGSNVLAELSASPVVRASEPDLSETKETNKLAGLAARIGLRASNPGQRSIWKRFRSGSWQVLETSNFRVHAADDQLAGQIADIAESTRIELYRTWYSKLPDANWSPKCDIFVHDSADQYARVTRQGPGSPGHSQTGIEQNRISSRRIDLRRDGNDLVHAILPHEITHIVLADRFSARPMPRWADEGIAVLTEPNEKKNAHLKNLGDMLKRGRVFTARQLMTMQDYPSGSQWPMFYAQSVSLVEFLVNRQGPGKFVEFMERSLQNGYESELKRTYELASFEELDRIWSRGRLEQIATASDGIAAR